MDWVHQHPHSVLEHCVCLPQLVCWVGTQITRFLIKMNHKKSHLKGLQRTTPDGSGALASIQYTITLCLPSTHFLLLWLRNTIHFAFMAGTKITRFLIKMNHKISHLKGLQRTTPDGQGALTSTQCTRILCLLPTTFLFVWLRNKIHFALVVLKLIQHRKIRPSS